MAAPSAPASRLIVGGGRAANQPPRRAGDLCLDWRVTDVRPDVRGTALALPFRSGSFSEVLFERIPYHVLTDRGSVGLAEAARVLRPGDGWRSSRASACRLRSSKLDWVPPGSQTSSSRYLVASCMSLLR